MKKFVTLALLGAFGVSMIGCSASVDVDPHKSDTSSTDVSKKTTTVRDANGNVVEKKTTETISR